MPEDEYDFEGANPAGLLPLDKSAQSFDYETQLHQKGYTKTYPPDTGELFNALATEYVPSVTVDLPPKVVERRKIVYWPPSFIQAVREFLGENFIFCLFFLLSPTFFILLFPALGLPILLTFFLLLLILAL